MFLDVHAEYNRQQLIDMVALSEMMLVYLSAGYLSNPDCITELAAAAYYGVPIVWVMDLTYKLPSPLPHTFKDGSTLTTEDIDLAVKRLKKATHTMKGQMNGRLLLQYTLCGRALKQSA